MPRHGALCTIIPVQHAPGYDAICTMRRFTVSLPDDLYAAIRRRGDEATPPASLQQMIRFAVDSLLATDGQSAADSAGPIVVAGDDTVVEPVDLLVFSVREVNYGIPIELVETVAAGLGIHSVPTSSASMLGVAQFREGLAEVHDGGVVLQERALDHEETPALLAIARKGGRVLVTVTSVTGLTPADAIRWADPPASSPEWVMALAWSDGEVIAVVDPKGFKL